MFDAGNFLIDKLSTFPTKYFVFVFNLRSIVIKSNEKSLYLSESMTFSGASKEFI